eukprot:gnl/TRDRNA2_/TRDRNA2_159494_c0_seq3.p1 gnl/TRDRNA2_/TRDRNA2_159494_c0~~gnl/TRDRNA2_/TRDRNA2_159494_c0_seq3.p1  ORF type:complete len:400 (+),score=20.94 gnl/TRDRNA2_/TRDRNA2_159494_c0_seq3:101-1300(+)
MPHPAGVKLFVGSLPDAVPSEDVKNAFAKYGQVVEVYVKPHCPPGKQMAFVTFQDYQEAMQAKQATHRQLMLPYSDKPVEVMFARTQTGGGGSYEDSVAKLHVGSLPNDTSENVLFEEFSKYGTVIDVYTSRLRSGVDTGGKSWALITFLTHWDALNAQQATDRKLILPGCPMPVPVKFARNTREGAPVVQLPTGSPSLYQPIGYYDATQTYAPQAYDPAYAYLPAYAQASYGQGTYGQAGYGQVGYGQALAGKSQAGQASYGQLYAPGTYQGYAQTPSYSAISQSRSNPSLNAYTSYGNRTTVKRSRDEVQAPTGQVSKQPTYGHGYEGTTASSSWDGKTPSYGPTTNWLLERHVLEVRGDRIELSIFCLLAAVIFMFASVTLRRFHRSRKPLQWCLL